MAGGSMSHPAGLLRPACRAGRPSSEIGTAFGPMHAQERQRLAREHDRRGFRSPRTDGAAGGNTGCGRRSVSMAARDIATTDRRRGAAAHPDDRRSRPRLPLEQDLAWPRKRRNRKAPRFVVVSRFRYKTNFRNRIEVEKYKSNLFVKSLLDRYGQAADR